MIRKVFAIIVSVIFLASYSSISFAHGGRLNSEGCHNNRSTGQYHCHRGNSSGSSSSASSSSSLGEDYYNAQLAAHFGGQTEVIIDFNYGLKGNTTGQASVRIDIVTDQFAIEGGLDKRSSLDSIQQAVFAASQLGLKPAVAIYDTDGTWGKYEHRVWTVAKELGVKYFWVSNNQVLEP